MRAEPTLAERKLWKKLRKLQLDGYRFRRQHIINRFIVDFYCPEVRLIIEVDGEIHKKQKLFDKERDTFLKDLGYRILHFRNNEVFMKTTEVLDSIRAACIEDSMANKPQSPFPFQGEG